MTSQAWFATRLQGERANRHWRSVEQIVPEEKMKNSFYSIIHILSSGGASVALGGPMAPLLVVEDAIHRLPVFRSSWSLS